MTETQSTPDHRAPLAPGEMRKHQVGTRLFRVMHISGGSFTQASVVEANTPTRVLATEMFEQDAVRAYADAIEQAESDAADALEGDDTPEPLPAPAPRSFIDGGATCQRAENADFDDPHRRHLLRQGDACDLPTPAPAPVLADACCAFVEQGGITTHEDGCPRFWKLTPEEEAYRAAVREISAPAPTLADDVAALRSEIKRWAQQGDTRYGDCMAILDRIAARAPRRATWNGAPWYRHECGYVTTFEPAPQDGGCDACESGSLNAADWRPLYVEPDGA